MHKANMEWYNVVYEPQFILPLILVTGFVVVVSVMGGSLWYLNSVRKELDTYWPLLAESGRWTAKMLRGCY